MTSFKRQIFCYQQQESIKYKLWHWKNGTIAKASKWTVKQIHIFHYKPQTNHTELTRQGSCRRWRLWLHWRPHVSQALYLYDTWPACQPTQSLIGHPWQWGGQIPLCSTTSCASHLVSSGHRLNWRKQIQVVCIKIIL